MKLIGIIFILTVITAFISGSNTPYPTNISAIERQIDSFNTETKINQELFRIKINKISNPKI